MTDINSRISALSTEAAAAGDLAQVRICEAALAGDATALTECERVLADAAAQCHICGCGDGERYWSCCANPADGSSGTGCDHEGGSPTCGPCGAAEGWWDDDDAAEAAEAAEERREAAEAVEWGDVEDYYPDDEAEERREDWDSDGRAWAEAIREALDATTLAAQREALADAAQIEREWGDCPATDRVARILGVD